MCHEINALWNSRVVTLMHHVVNALWNLCYFWMAKFASYKPIIYKNYKSAFNKLTEISNDDCVNFMNR